MQLCNVHAELISLFQDSPSTVLDEGIKSCCELVHACAQVVETKVNAGQLVCHRRHIVRSAHRATKGGLKGGHLLGIVRQLLAHFCYVVNSGERMS